MIQDEVRSKPVRMVFAEGEEETVIRAALQWRGLGLGTPLLIGREDVILETMSKMGLSGPESLKYTMLHLANTIKFTRTFSIPVNNAMECFTGIVSAW